MSVCIFRRARALGAARAAGTSCGRCGQSRSHSRSTSRGSRVCCSAGTDFGGCSGTVVGTIGLVPRGNFGHVAGFTYVGAEIRTDSLEGGEVSGLAETRFVGEGVRHGCRWRDAAGLGVLEDGALLGARREGRVAEYQKLLGRSCNGQRCDNGQKTHGGWMDA